MEAVAAAVLEHGEAAALDGLDPSVSPLLSMLPAGAVAVLWVAASARDGSPIAQWAEAEMATTRRRADGWLVAGATPTPASRSRAAGPRTS